MLIAALPETPTRSWGQFYADRFNPRYRSHIHRKYATYFEEIARLARGLVVEVGAGAGFASRAMLSYLEPSSSAILLENDPDQLRHLRYNTCDLWARVYACDVRNPQDWPVSVASVVCGHGFLEHFDDDTIRELIWHQRAVATQAVVHYVPTNRYITPSFGDERLLSARDWAQRHRPHHVVPFNDGYDLLLVWKSSR